MVAGHGSAEQQVGAAAARRVQLQLRGVAASVQRARLPASARAAPAGAQDAAGQPGAELQVQGQPAGAGATLPGKKRKPGGGVRHSRGARSAIALLAQFPDRGGITPTLSGETPYW